MDYLDAIEAEVRCRLDQLRRDYQREIDPLVAELVRINGMKPPRPVYIGIGGDMVNWAAEPQTGAVTMTPKTPADARRAHLAGRTSVPRVGHTAVRCMGCGAARWYGFG